MKAALLLSAPAFAQQNLIINGDFEGRNSPAPRGYDNIGPQTPSHPYDDLASWYTTASNADNRPAYIATDGANDVNPHHMFDFLYQYYGLDYSFDPHSSKSCVFLAQHDEQGDHSSDRMITQELASALIPGHTYEASFWVLRSFSGRYRTKLALWVTDGVPNYDYTTSTVTPSYGNKIVEAPDNILDTKHWTYVSGRFTIPNSPGNDNNRWVTIGYDPKADQYFDTEIEEPLSPPNHASFITYAVDDASLVDVTCDAIAIAPDINLAPLLSVNPANGARQYDVRVNNVGGATSFRLLIEAPDGNGGWITNGSWSNSTIVSVYTGPDDPNNNEAQYFTTFHTHLIGATGPNQGSGQGVTYRFTVTAIGACNSIIAQKVITLPAYDGDGQEGSRTVVNSSTTAYPNPATESIIIPDGTEGATLVNDKGKTLRTADSSGKLDVQSLPDGLYNLQMMHDGKLINQRIQVKH